MDVFEQSQFRQAMLAHSPNQYLAPLISCFSYLWSFFLGGSDLLE